MFRFSLVRLLRRLFEGATTESGTRGVVFWQERATVPRRATGSSPSACRALAGIRWRCHASVEDRWQRLGLGAILLGEILPAGGQREICEFRADVLAYNGGMLRLLAHHTDVERRRTLQGIAEISVRRRKPPLSADVDAMQR